MYDRRIVRGNTYAQRTLPAVSFKEQMKAQGVWYRVLVHDEDKNNLTHMQDK